MNSDDFGFTYIYNILREYGRIYPQFAKNQIKDFIHDLKRSRPRFNNFAMRNGDILIKLTMAYPNIFKDCIIAGLGKYSNTFDLINWALFCGPMPPGTLTPITPEIRETVLNIILDSADISHSTHTNTLLNILLYFPTNPVLIQKLFDKFPTPAISNDWILTFIHRGNPSNIPYIVAHKNNREIAYQTPSFLSKSLPAFRQQLAEDESILGPNETQDQYYNKLEQLQTYIDQAKPIIRRENWNLIFWMTRLIIYIQRFKDRFYEPVKGPGYITGAASWASQQCA